MPVAPAHIVRALKAKDRSLDLVWSQRNERWVIIRRDDAGKEFVIKMLQNPDGSYREPREGEIMKDLHDNDIARFPGLTWKDKQRNFIRSLRQQREELKEKEWAAGEQEDYDRWVDWKELANKYDGDFDRMEIAAAQRQENLANDMLTPSMRAKIRALSTG